MKNLLVPPTRMEMKIHIYAKIKTLSGRQRNCERLEVPRPVRKSQGQESLKGNEAMDGKPQIMNNPGFTGS